MYVSGYIRVDILAVKNTLNRKHSKCIASLQTDNLLMYSKVEKTSFIFYFKDMFVPKCMFYSCMYISSGKLFYFLLYSQKENYHRKLEQVTTLIYCCHCFFIFFLMFVFFLLSMSLFIFSNSVYIFIFCNIIFIYLFLFMN